MDVLKVDYKSSNASALFTQSLRETGFAVLTNHPIAKELVEKAYASWEKFFSSVGKFNYILDIEKQDGYIPFDKSEKAKGHELKDLKEFFHFYQWGRCPESTREVTQQLYNELSSLAATLLKWIEDHTPADIAKDFSMPLSEMIKSSPQTLLRIINYPPLTGNEQPGAVRAAPHEDINLITLLPAATANGLQVLDQKGHWHDVPCDHTSLVINAGDMLQMCSQGYYRSTTHRVCNPIGEEAKKARLSMPLFLHPRSDVRLSPTHTAHDYLMERLRELELV